MINSIGPSNTGILRNLNSNSTKINKLYDQLSSGKRITSFSVDPAGGAISQKMRAQFEQYDREISNYEDNISRYNTEEGAYSAIGDSLQEIRKLQVQARNDTLTDEDRDAIQQQIDMQIDAMKLVTDSAEFNTKKVVEPGEDLSKIFEEGIDAQGDFVDKAIEEVSGHRAELGAKINTTEKTISREMIAYENTVAAYSTISDMDMAKGIVDKAGAELLQQAGTMTMKKMFEVQRSNILNLLG